MSQDKTATSKPAKKYQPTRLEVVKSIAIAVLVTGIVAFIAGAKFAGNRQTAMDNAVHAAAPEAEPTVAPSK